MLGRGAPGGAKGTFDENVVTSTVLKGGVMPVQPATISRASSPEDAPRFVPSGSYRGSLEDFGYVEEEWFVSGEVDGRPYRSQLTVRRPRDTARFSGIVLVEPVHAASAAPMWIYTSLYQMRSGHGWAAVCSQKTVLDSFVKPTNPALYESLDIWTDVAPDEASVNPLALPRDPARIQQRIEHMRRVNVLSSDILAQVGAGLSAPSDDGPFCDAPVRDTLLMGHSQTGMVVTNYILSVHDKYRYADGSPIYHGFFPSGAPAVQFGPRDVPLVQVVSEGDISHPTHGPMRTDRGYRRDDSDDPTDRYRLYELAGAGHMNTRFPPYSDNATWQIDPTGTAGAVPAGAIMNSLPHGEMFSACLDHLIRWAVTGVVPPRAARIDTGEDGLFVKDDFGNSRGGVRCAQMNVPRNRYMPNPGMNPDGTPAFGVVGIEEPLRSETLKDMYRDHQDYVERFSRSVDDLINEGWLLPADADEMRAEAEAAPVP
jgi:Alpha/beta hydrolase domain